MAWPDVEVIISDNLADLGDTFLRLTPEWTQRFEVADPTDPPNPVIHIYAIGGNSNIGPLRSSRLIVDVFTASRDESREVALTVRDRLTSGPLWTEADGLVDNMTCEVEPILLPFTHDRIVQWRATYRAEMRPVPA